jgi:hypothetical protein
LNDIGEYLRTLKNRNSDEYIYDPVSRGIARIGGMERNADACQVRR